MKKQFIECGKIVSTQGIKGEVRVQPWSDTPDFLCDFDEFFVLQGNKKFNVESARVNKNVVVIKFAEINSVEEAEKLRNHVLYIDRKEIKLEKGVYLVDDLIGLRVIDAESKEEYGTLSEVTPTGAKDVYHIKREGKEELLFPAIPEIIKKTDIENGVMEITPLKGLFDDED